MAFVSSCKLLQSEIHKTTIFHGEKKKEKKKTEDCFCEVPVSFKG